MRGASKYLQEACLAVIFLLLFLPVAQSTFHLKKWVRPLNGAYEEKPDTVLTPNTWFSELYQQKKSDYLNQHFGLRNYYVRLKNQIDFTFFEKINTQHVVMGKAGVLFEDSYINARYGRNFAGEKKLKDLAIKLKKAQEMLKANGIDLEILFLPGKATFFTEFIPDRCKDSASVSNYAMLAQEAKKVQLNYIDMNSWFAQLKSKSQYDLYPAGGIHWSNYGALLAFDSLCRHIESNLPIRLSKFDITEVTISSELQDPDNDIAESLNLWKDPRPLSMPYAKYKWRSDSQVAYPKALFVGDSYFWNWAHQGLVKRVFNAAEFWYYNQPTYLASAGAKVKELPFEQAVKANRVIVLMATESNIHDIGWGFADEVIRHFNNSGPGISAEKDPEKEARRKQVYVRFFLEEMKNAPAWLDDIKKKAAARKISLNEMMEQDAIYLYNTEYNTTSARDYTERIRKQIMNDENWLKQVKAKAKEKNMNLDEMLELDAKYMYDREIKGKK